MFKPISYILLVTLFIAIPGLGQTQANELSFVLHDKLQKSEPISSQYIHTQPILKKYYQERGFNAVWFKDNYKLKREAKDLLKVLSKVEQEGLNSQDYHFELISEKIDQARKFRKKDNYEELAELELLLSDAFLSLGFHLLYGKVGFRHGKSDSIEFKPRWYAPMSENGLTSLMENAVSSEQVREQLYRLLPKNKAYKKLRKKLAEYKELAQEVNWPQIPRLPRRKKLTLGDKDERILLIKQRLDLLPSISKETWPEQVYIFDEELDAALRKFQDQHGLLVDGVVGWRTLKVLNQTIAQKIELIKINLDRQRSMAGFFEEPRNIIVNIANFNLEVKENHKKVMDMRVIVGMKKRMSPMLSSEIDHLIFSPKWFVPDTILIEDKLPLVQEDPAYFKKHGMKVYEKGTERSKEAEPIDPETIDWSAIDFDDPEEVPFRVVQNPGAYNALGRVKFMFPNRHAVYLHDTPSKRLFNNSYRAFSSGCIRIQKPIEMAKYLLKDKNGWDKKKIKRAMNRGREQIVTLSKPMPLHIIYMTSWVDENNQLQFRNDIYGLDAAYKKAFNQ